MVPASNEKEAYFSRWDTHLTRPSPSGREQLYQRCIRDYSSGVIGGDTLDIGCGSYVYYKLDRVTRWVGMEVSPIMLKDIQFAEGKPPANMDILIHGCETLPFPDGSFDTVCAMFVLHHLACDNRERSREIVTNTLREIRRVLRPGGALVVAENSPRMIGHPYRFLYAPCYYFGRKFLSLEAPLFWTEKELIRMAEPTGFTDILYCHLPIRDRIPNPVLGGVACFPWLTELLQRMTLYVMR